MVVAKDQGSMKNNTDIVSIITLLSMTLSSFRVVIFEKQLSLLQL
jgi:hypothetical protein